MISNKFHSECAGCSTRLNSIFCNLNKDEMIRFSESKSCLNYLEGHMVFNEGNIPHGLFIINSGKIKISKYSNEGKEQIVRFAKDGDIIGYRALLSGEKYTCSASAINKISICFIPKHTFFDLLTRNGDLALKMMKLLANDLRKAESKITQLAQKPVRERMAEALLILRETYGCESDEKTINIYLSRTEIANMVGTARETATRLLYEFKDDGMVELKGKKIAIIDQKKLVKTANIFD